MQDREECLWCTRTTSVEIGLNAMRWPPCVPTHTASGLDTMFVTAAWGWETPEIPKMALQGIEEGKKSMYVLHSYLSFATHIGSLSLKYSHV